MFDTFGPVQKISETLEGLMSMKLPPLYAQIAEHLRGKIRTGELQPGDLMPTERDLAAERGISRSTAVRALETLVSEGLVSAGQGRAGRRVRDLRVMRIHASLSERLDRRLGAGTDAWVTDTTESGRLPGQTVDVGVVSASPEIARLLDVDGGESVAVRRRLRTVDGDPSNTSDTYYPMSIAKEIPEILDPRDVQPGVIALMAERGYKLTRFSDELRFRPPTPEEAQILRIGQGTSVCVQWRTGYVNEQAVHLTRTVWPGDTIALVYSLPAVGE